MKDNEVQINDLSLGLYLREALRKKKIKDPFKEKNKKDLRNYKHFTKEELESIKSLTIAGGVVDISDLKYCTNLKKLDIISANPSMLFFNESHPETTLSVYANYYVNHIRDFSVINKLKNLEFLTVEFENSLKVLDVENLPKLRKLKLRYNQNLKEVKGLENIKRLYSLELLKNNIVVPFDLPKILSKGSPKVELDFDIYPLLIEEYPDLCEKINEFDKNNYNKVKWIENISDLGVNKINTKKMKLMDDKANKILNSVIKTNYSDKEKLSAIYSYIMQNVEYDYLLISIEDNDKLKEYVKRKKNISENELNKILDMKQSSYNGIMANKCICEGYTNMMHYLLKKVGIKSYATSCSSIPNLKLVGIERNHAVIRVRIDNKWRYYDPTSDALILQESKIPDYFYKTKKEFSRRFSLIISEKNINTKNENKSVSEEAKEILKKEYEKQLNNKFYKIYSELIKNNESYNALSNEEKVYIKCGLKEAFWKAIYSGKINMIKVDSFNDIFNKLIDNINAKGINNLIKEEIDDNKEHMEKKLTLK